MCIIDTRNCENFRIKLFEISNLIQTKHLCTIFPDRIRHKRVSPLTKQVFRKLYRIPSRLSTIFSTHGDRAGKFDRSIRITRFVYGINIHRRNWIRGANGNSRIGELITGNEEQTELSLAVLRRLIVFVRLRETEPEVSRGRHVINNFISRSGVENLAN